MFAYFLQDNRYMSFIGMILILLVAFLFSRRKRDLNFRLIGSALTMQFALGFFTLKTTFGMKLFGLLARAFSKVYEFAGAGAEFIFGRLVDTSGSWGMIFLVHVVPVVIFFGAVMSVLFHLGVIQFFVKIVSKVLRPLLGTSGAETLCAAASSMLGPTEAPLMIRKYLHKMTDSEILVVLVSGMATMTGAILAVYGSIGVSVQHMLAASIMSIPGALLIAKILLPEDPKLNRDLDNELEVEVDSDSILDAISKGTTDGVNLSIGMVSMLIVFISLIAMADYVIGYATGATIGVCWTLNSIFAYFFSWVAMFLGIPLQDQNAAGALLGQKIAINEFVAYAHFVKMDLLPRTRTVLTYALCGFANISVIGIQVGGIGALVPSKRNVIIKLGTTALLGGTLANLLNATIAGMLI